MKAQALTIADRQIVPIIERTAWLSHRGGWYMTRVCSLRIEENGIVYDYPLIPFSPDQNDHQDNPSGKADPKTS